MKKNLVVLFLALAIVGCSASLERSFEEKTGSVKVSFEDAGRTLAPGLNMTVGSYKAVFTKGEETKQFDIGAESTADFTLPVGPWTIDVFAYNTDTPAKKIGVGSGAVTVTAGATSSVTIAVVPVAGVGTLSLSLNWGTLTLSAPSVTGVLTPVQSGQAAVPLSFLLSSGAAVSQTPNIPTGYYTLTLQLKDAGVVKASVAEAVRIVDGQVTYGNISFIPGGDLEDGTVSVTVVISLDLPKPVTLLGLDAQISVGTSVSVTASSPETQDSWAWYLDGVLQNGTASTFTIPGTLSLGSHRIDALGRKGDKVSSGYSIFQVVNEVQLPEVWATPPGKQGGVIVQPTVVQEKVEVTLGAANPAQGSYTLNNGVQTAFVSGDKILLVAPDGQTVNYTLKLKNQTAEATYTYQVVGKPVDSGFTVYVYSPAGAPYIWTWEDGTGGRPIMTLEGYNWSTNHPQMTPVGDDWYSWSVPSKYLPLKAALKIILNKQGAINHTRTATGWFDGTTWTDTDPRVLKVTLDPAGGSFTEDKVVTVTVSGPGSAQAVVTGTLGGVAVGIVDGKVTVPLGSWAVNTKKTLAVKAVSGTTEATASGEFTRMNQVDPPVGDVSNLRMYQVMVEAYRDSDGQGFSAGYGPSAHKGDLKGIEAALPYIKSLGVNALWMTPIFHSTSGPVAMQTTGYYADNYFAIDPRFGDEQDFKDLVKACHDAGLYVILDGVFGHHGANIQPSPTGKKPVALKPQWEGFEVDYSKAETLEFYKEVATYWITKYGIDGWRLDQSYQVPVDKWKSIREAVEAAAAARKAANEPWGTLGYMVGEQWDGNPVNIQASGYGPASAPGLKSLFDFPVRYKLVQVLATQERYLDANAYGLNASVINDMMNTSKSVYASHAVPNLMLTNHDIVRFGDLIQRAPNLGYDGSNPDYWKRHKLALGFMAAYTGPITLYYGDEYGAEVSGFVKEGDRNFYDDHASRDDGKIDGFNTSQQDLINFVKSLWTLRSQNESLWKGARTNLLATSTLYADKKDGNGKDYVVIMNTSTSAQSASLSSVGGSGLKDVLTGETFTGSGSYTVAMPALGYRLLEIQ